MNQHSFPVQTGHSACPHDCPSTCALEIDISGGRIGGCADRAANTYTAGVICAKVSRYAERANHADRLTQPLRRVGAKGEGAFAPITWDEALDEIAHRFREAEQRYGAEAVWPYYYAGTMGLVMRDGINRLTHAKGYSRFFSSICVNPAWGGFMAGTGKLAGPDPREIAKADLVVIWGTNPVATQVNVMTHAIRARKDRGAKIAVIDVYRSPTMEQADIPVLIRPGTDGALACAIMHVLFRDNLADRAYLAQFADDPAGLEAHLQARTPQWAEAITGLPAAEIEAFAHAIGRTPRTYIRAGYGFTRSRNGAVNMHAVSCIATVAGLWQHEGGGAFHTNGAIFRWKQTAHRGAGRPRHRRAPARPVAHRRYPDRRSRRVAGRPAGRRHADPEHQSGVGGARSGQGAARLRPRGPVRRRARAVHDRDGPHGRHRAAGDHVHRA